MNQRHTNATSPKTPDPLSCPMGRQGSKPANRAQTRKQPVLARSTACGACSGVGEFIDHESIGCDPEPRQHESNCTILDAQVSPSRGTGMRAGDLQVETNRTGKAVLRETSDLARHSQAKQPGMAFDVKPAPETVTETVSSEASSKNRQCFRGGIYGAGLRRSASRPGEERGHPSMWQRSTLQNSRSLSLRRRRRLAGAHSPRAREEKKEGSLGRGNGRSPLCLP
jgi:hypothetical protein